MTKAVVVELSDGDLYYQIFDSIEEAREYSEELKWKSVLIIGDNLSTEDHT